MKKNIILFLVSITSFGLFANNKKDFIKDFDKATSEYKAGNYYAALPLFLELYKVDTTNANINYFVGLCYMNARSKKARAIVHLEKAVKFVSPDYKENNAEELHAPLLAYKILGDAYHIHSMFDKALASYALYKRESALKGKKDPDNLKAIDRKIEMCKTAKELMSSPVNIKIENMGKNLNSAYADYSPVLTADQSVMIFTSRRNTGTGGETYEGGKFFEDIYISSYNGTSWSTAENIGAPVNTSDNEASVGISPDGQEILIYKDDNGDGNIYSTTLDGDVWTPPVKLNSNINSKHWEPSAFISADGNSIFFTSDRPGGFGGRDIYKSQKNEDGEWDKAINMGALINTSYDEDAPFIHPDGVTLFFSSNGHKTMGGFDIFYSTLSDNGIWQAPVNVGYPVNSPDDDIFYVVSPDKTKAYYSSFKENGYGEKDNYMITFPGQKKAPLTLVKGIVKDPEGNVPKGISITVTDNETGKVIVVNKPNSKSGQYLFILTPGKNYNISYEADGFLFYSENRQIPKKTNYYEVSKAIQLPPITTGSKIVLNNIFFDFDKATLRKTSEVELKNILRFLNKYSKVVVEIAGYTDSKGTPQYNIKLSQERASSVVAYLVEKGITKERLIAKGYGETGQAVSNEKLNGDDSPEGRQLNRRVELKIMEIK